MKQLLATAAIASLCVTASPCWAQANGAATDCLSNIEIAAHANGLIIGAGAQADIPIHYLPCDQRKMAELAALMTVNSANAHLDPETVQWWNHMTRQVYCANSLTHDIDTEGLCRKSSTAAAAVLTPRQAAPAAVASAPSVSPPAPAPLPSQHIDTSPVVATLSVAPQHASPPIVAAVSSSQPWYASCPAGVPISECYR